MHCNPVLPAHSLELISPITGLNTNTGNAPPNRGAWTNDFLRDLLYAVFLSGDGNFHLQSMARCKDLKSDPSLFGDSGAWVPYGTYHSYKKAAENGQSKFEVI